MEWEIAHRNVTEANRALVVSVIAADLLGVQHLQQPSRVRIGRIVHQAACSENVHQCVKLLFLGPSLPDEMRELVRHVALETCHGALLSVNPLPYPLPASPRCLPQLV